MLSIVHTSTLIVIECVDNGSVAIPISPKDIKFTKYSKSDLCAKLNRLIQQKKNIITLEDVEMSTVIFH